MLGKTAGGLYWMSRYLERSKNVARLVDAGFRISITQSQSANSEWASIVATTGAQGDYLSVHNSDYDSIKVIDFLLRDENNPSSVFSIMKNARNNARMCRTALTRDVWEAVNESWIHLVELFSAPIAHENLPNVLSFIRRQSAQVQGAFHATMLRNDIYDFTRLGTFVERADNTARILDVKYYVLLPSANDVGSALDNAQWETILRSVSAEQSYRWHHRDEITPSGVAQFLILDRILPQSLAYIVNEILTILGKLSAAYQSETQSCHLARKLNVDLAKETTETIFESGLHEFINQFLKRNNALAAQIEHDYRFSV